MNSVYITNIVPLLRKEVYEYYYDRVGKYRQEKADKLKKTADKARCIGVGALLRFAIEDATTYNFDDLTVKTTDKGKPYIEDIPFYISVSHSGDYAVCAISDSPIGVDVEKERDLPERIQKRFAKDIVEWTKKEAKGKLTGNGFFDSSPDKYIYSHERVDGYLITACSDKKIDRFLTYHLPFPC